MSTDSVQPQSSSSSPSSNPDRQATYDPSWYTWSRFFRILSNTASTRQTQEYIHADSIAREQEICTRCEKWRDWMFEYSPTVRFMREHCAKLGGDLNEDNVSCRRCETLGEGATQLKKAAFHRDFGILLCANHLPNKGEQEDAMAHEMVHAFDFLKFKYQEKNLKHVACTEIRASMLSGECRWVREFWQRKQRHRFTMLFQDCVRRRAVQSVQARPDCENEKQAVKIVNEAWDNCFSDTRPFDEVYR